MHSWMFCLMVVLFMVDMHGSVIGKVDRDEREEEELEELFELPRTCWTKDRTLGFASVRLFSRLHHSLSGIKGNGPLVGLISLDQVFQLCPFVMSDVGSLLYKGESAFASFENVLAELVYDEASKQLEYRELHWGD